MFIYESKKLQHCNQLVALVISELRSTQVGGRRRHYIPILQLTQLLYQILRWPPIHNCYCYAYMIKRVIGGVQFLSFIIMHNRDTPMNQFTFFNRNILSTLIHFDVYIYSTKNILSLVDTFREIRYKCNNYDGYNFSGQ